MTMYTTEKSPIITTLSIDPIHTLGWKTVLFNCNCHTFDAVIQQIMRAIQCTREKADNLASTADSTGSVIVYESTKEKCEKVAKVLGSIGLVVTVTQ